MADGEVEEILERWTGFTTFARVGPIRKVVHPMESSTGRASLVPTSVCHRLRWYKLTPGCSGRRRTIPTASNLVGRVRTRTMTSV